MSKQQTIIIHIINAQEIKADLFLDYSYLKLYNSRKSIDALTAKQHYFLRR